MNNPTSGSGGRLRTATTPPSILALLLAMLGALAPAATALTNPDPSLIAVYEPCEPNTGVTVIVDFQSLRTGPGDEPVYVRCAPGEQATGFAALQSAGFAPQGTERWGPAFVCRLLGLPTPAGEPCVNTPPASAYWSYWKSRPGGQWSYSAYGSADPQNPVPEGSVEGWSFSTSTPSPAPRLAPLDATGPGELTTTINPDGQAAAETTREWLLDETTAILADSTLTARAKIAKTVGSGVFLALASGGNPGDTAGLNTLLSGGLRDYVSKGTEGSVFADLLSQVVLAVTARGGDPGNFNGEDLRAELLSLLAGPGSGVEGKVQNRSLKKGVPTYAHNPITVNNQALAVLALARSGGVPSVAVDFLRSTQLANGSFSSPLTTAATLRGDTALATLALAAARDRGAAGLDEPIARAADWLSGFQRDDGAVLAAGTGGQPEAAGVELTALAARTFAAAGKRGAAERAAAYLSSMQLVAAYAGDGAAKTDLGAVAPSLASLKEALRYGILTNQREGFRNSSGQALLGLEAALYGPAHLTPTPAAPAFPSLQVGDVGEPQEIELLSSDRRVLRVSAVRVEGNDAGEFRLGTNDCDGKDLAYGEGCAVAVSFSPDESWEGPREARLELVLEGIAAPVTVHLTATATVPAEIVELPPVVRPADPGQPEPPPLSAGDAAVRTGTRTVSRERTVTLATLTCNASFPCLVRAPRRVRVTIAGRHYGVWVLAPASLGPGESTPLLARLSPRGVAALLGVATPVRVRVWLGAGDRFEVQEIEVRVAGTLPAVVPLAKKRSARLPRASVAALRKETAR